MAKINKSLNTKWWKGCRITGSLILCWWKMVQTLWITGWQFLIKLNIHRLYDPVISLLCNYSNEMKPYVHRETYVNTLSSIIHKRSKLETTQRSIKGKMDKQIEVDSQDGIVCNNEKERNAYTQQNEYISKILCAANGARKNNSSCCLIQFFCELQEQAK